MSAPLIIVGWLWDGPIGYTAEHANIWARMIHAHLKAPHRFVLITDQPQAKYDELIMPIAIWNDWRELKSPCWPKDKPHCYVRLKAFSEEFGDLLLSAFDLDPFKSVRFVSIDLDCLVLSDLDVLFARPEDFLIYRRPIDSDNPRQLKTPYQGSMWMMNDGARKQVWTEFRGADSVEKRVDKARIGTDQAWICEILGPNEAGWGLEDGVLSFSRHIAQPGSAWFGKRPEEVPYPARIIFFQGGLKPFHFPDPRKMLGDRKTRREYQRILPGGVIDFGWIGEKYWKWA